MRRIFLNWAPFALYTALIVYLSLTPHLPEGPRIYQIDKLYHFMAYAIMGLLLARAVATGPALKTRTGAVVLITALAGFLFGALMEIGQMFVPERTAEALDALANGAGAFVGAVVYGRFIHKKD
ncbi:MAG: VanZ family protein [Deltaproteobacteria bacterium]|nr:VanZ family protein [Deltaproteobacteria bacterium]